MSPSLWMSLHLPLEPRRRDLPPRLRLRMMVCWTNLLRQQKPLRPDSLQRHRYVYLCFPSIRC
jgi:hypothetical protein